MGPEGETLNDLNVDDRQDNNVSSSSSPKVVSTPSATTTTTVNNDDDIEHYPLMNDSFFETTEEEDEVLEEPENSIVVDEQHEIIDETTTTASTNIEENNGDTMTVQTMEETVGDNDKFEDSSVTADSEDQQQPELSSTSPVKSNDNNGSPLPIPLEPVDVQICYENYADLRTFLETFGTIDNFHAHVKRGGDESLTQQKEPTVEVGPTGMVRTTHYRYEVPETTKNSVLPSSSPLTFSNIGAAIPGPGRPCKFEICPTKTKPVPIYTNKSQKIWTPRQVTSTSARQQQTKRTSIFREVNGENGQHAMDLHEGQEEIRGPSVSSRGRKRMRSTRLVDL